MSCGPVTPFGRWLARRGPFTRGMVYGWMLFGYAVEGAVRGWFAGICEGIEAWKEDRAFLESLVRRSGSEG